MLINSVISIVLTLLCVLFLGGLFSLLETAIIAISEHRLETLKTQKSWAHHACLLKQELEKVLIFSLFGNSLFNAIFTTLATILVSSYISHRLHSEIILPIATLAIALFIIIFSEAIPKVIAAKNPALILKIIAIPLYYIFRLCKPIIWVIDRIIYSMTQFVNAAEDAISPEELKAIIADKRSLLKRKHRSILLNLMGLDNLTIREVLIPLRMVEAINLNGNIQAICKQIYTSHHTRMPVYVDIVDNIIGFIHVKDLVSLEQRNITREALRKVVRPIEFINDFMSIVKQINRSGLEKTRIFVVINEYGDVLGIACLEDMLEMVFGDFTTESPQQKTLSIKTVDNNIIVDGTMLLRDLNDKYHLDLKLPPAVKTVNGLVFYVLNAIPNIGVCFKWNNLILEVISIGAYWVERVKITVV